MIKYKGEVIETNDGKQWIYSYKDQEWIDVTPVEKLKDAVRVR
jgi:hypothetical protein